MTGPRRRKVLDEPIQRRCLDPDCKRLFETLSPDRQFCCSAHAHRAHRTWYREGKQRAQFIAKPVPPESDSDRRKREAKRRADEIASRNLADPMFMAEFHRTMNEALARAKAPETPVVPS